jgi:hypothetical protein
MIPNKRQQYELGNAIILKLIQHDDNHFKNIDFSREYHRAVCYKGALKYNQRTRGAVRGFI